MVSENESDDMKDHLEKYWLMHRNQFDIFNAMD